MGHKYLQLHSFLRYGAALIAIIVFITMFTTTQIVHSEFSGANRGWQETFFGDEFYKATVLGFVGYLLVLLGGLTGLAFEFLDDMIGKDITKSLSFAVGAAMFVAAIFMLLTGVIFRGINEGTGMGEYHLAAGPIVGAIFAMIAGAMNAAAPILEDKGL